MAKPLVIIAPGSFSLESEYDALISHLGSSGYEAIAYGLPTTSKSPKTAAPHQQPSTLAEDAQFFNGVCAALCDQAQNVVIVGHSYGGMVITEAVKGLTGKRVGKGRVVGGVYLTAAAVKEGQSLGEVTKDLGFDFIKMEGDYMYHDPLEESARVNFSDQSPEKGLECARRFVYHSAPSFGNALQYAGYRDLDNVAYILCTADKTLNPEFQHSQIDNINAAREEAGKPSARVYQMNSGHCPNASKPVELARELVEAIRAFD